MSDYQEIIHIVKTKIIRCILFLEQRRNTKNRSTELEAKYTHCTFFIRFCRQCERDSRILQSFPNISKQGKQGH